MGVAYKPVPLRCVLMTISMGVLLILLCAGPACTHKNRGSKGASSTIFPVLRIPVLTAPPEDGATVTVKPTQKLPQSPHLPWPPRESWLLFLKNSDRPASIKKKGQESMLKYRRPGPIGPPAPPRHHGHHVNPTTQGKRIHRLLQLLRELLQKKQSEELNTEHEHPLDFLPSKVHAAFICRTMMDTNVEPGEQKEMQLYQLPEEEGSFSRGAGLNLTSGQYTAPFCGLYSFTARLLIGFEQPQMEGEGFLHVQLCIQSLCQQHLSLEEVRCVTDNQVPHTVTVNGLLYLQAGQYVSVYMTNKMGSQLMVEKGSSFSGVLLGV
ncbi:erythroferrone [Discoglossus pictus]